MAPAQAEAATPWVLTDASGDVAASPSAALASQAPRAVDIKSLTIDRDDELGLDLSLTVGSFATSSVAGAPGRYMVGITFAFEDQATYELSIYAAVFRKEDDPATLLVERLGPTLRVTRDGTGSTSYPNATLDPQRGIIRIPLEKAVLADVRVAPAGRPDEVVPPPLPLDAGAQLTSFAVAARYVEDGYANTTVEFMDQLPDGAPSPTPYVLKTGVANVHVRIFAPPAKSGPRVSPLPYYYAPGLNQSVSFHVHNVEGPRRLLRLGFEFLDPGAAAAGFQAFGPAAVSIPAGETRAFSFALRAPQAPQNAQPLRIRAESLVDGEVGMFDLVLSNGTVMGPAANKVRFVVQPAPPGPACGAGDPCFGLEGRLAARGLVPGFADQGRISYGLGLLSLKLDIPLAVPIALDPKGSIQVRVTMASRNVDVPDLKVSADLQARGGPGPGLPTLLLAEKTETVTPAGVTYQFTAAPPRGLEVVPGQCTFRLNLYSTVSADPGAREQRDAADLHVVAETSSITLPLVPVAPEFQTNAVPSPFQIGVRGEKDDFVNPGKVRLFNLTVINLDSMEQRLRVTVAPSAPWPFEVLPGLEYNVQSTQSLLVGLLVTAPADALDAPVLKIWVNATSDNDARVGIVLHLTAVDDPQRDDAGAFQPETEAEEALIRSGEESPAAGPGMLLAAGLTALVWARRRRRR